jgi:hypothetical protein
MQWRFSKNNHRRICGFNKPTEPHRRKSASLSPKSWPLNATDLESFHCLEDGTPAVVLRSLAAGAGGSLEPFMSASSILTYFRSPSRHRFRGLVSLRCDHCRRELGLHVQEYWRMRFCCSDCMKAYQQRLAKETKMKIYRLNAIANFG